MCNHCKMHVENALKGVDGVADAQVNLEQKTAEVTLAKDVAEGFVPPLVSRIEEKFHGFAEEIVQKLEKDYQLKNGVLKVTASIGVAVFPKDGATFADLYHHADIALYQAKRNGKNTYALYQGETE